MLAFAVIFASATSHAQVKERDHRTQPPPPPPPKPEPKPQPPPPPPPPAPKPVWDSTGWTQLGQQVVHGKNDRDVISVGKRAGRFSKLTIVVEDSDLIMKDIVVTFGNGEKFEPKTKVVFKENSRTRVFDLPGEARGISKIEFRYGNLPGGGKARVEVWGMMVDDREHRDPPKPPPPPPFSWDSKGWKMLGERSVDGRRDRDQIKVGPYEGRFDQLTFVVSDSDVEITKLTVWFENGKKFQPKVRHYFKEGARTRVVDLPGNDRLIKKIEMRYKNVAGGGRATVQVWGRNTRPWDSTGWTALGEQEVKGKSDRDVIKVGVREGRYSKLTLVVTDSDLELYDMNIHFADGTTYDPKLRMKFEEGSRTGVIDLPGEARMITKVEFHYGNLPGDGRRAKIQLWGFEVKADVKEREHRGKGKKPRGKEAGWRK
jgi:hypothetical protein